MIRGSTMSISVGESGEKSLIRDDDAESVWSIRDVTGRRIQVETS
jgi:hypothetical protein